MTVQFEKPVKMFSANGSVSGVAYVKCNYYAYALVTATYVCFFFFSRSKFLARESIV